MHFSKIYKFIPEKEIIKVKPPVFLTFSTGFFDLMADVCNRAIAMKNKNAVLDLNLNQIELLSHKTIRSNVVKFKVMSHAVLRGKNGYLDNVNPSQIEEAINTHLKTKLDFFSKNITPIPFNNSIYSPIKLVEHCELAKGVCQHYGGKITSIRGNFTLEGYPDSLQFLYDYGLGVRTGQGFGLLKVVKQL